MLAYRANSSLHLRSGSVGSGEVKDTLKSAAASRARPTCPRPSGRLGVSPISRIVSRAAGRASTRHVPGRAVPSGRTSSPSPSSLRPISASLQSMPSLGTPAIDRRSIVSPFAGRWAPSGAKTTRPPGSGTLGAPQTTSSDLPPRSTATSRSPLRDGCGRTDTTPATRHASAPSPNSAVDSTSSPAAVSRSASAAGSSGSRGQSSRSQRTEAFIVCAQA